MEEARREHTARPGLLVHGSGVGRLGGRPVHEKAVREQPKIRQSYGRILPSLDDRIARGSASQVSDMLEDR
jgi:hypothetical protein